jgi:predicted TIM-barrel fold metal-dependent hydrolase
MNVELKPRPVAAAAVQQALADCDLHPTPKSQEKEVFPFLEKRWQDHLKTYGALPRVGFATESQYPKAQPNAGRRDAFPPGGGSQGSDLAFMARQHLDPNNVKFGVLIPLGPAQSAQNIDLGIALCSAMNQWQLAEWTSKDKRLRGSILIPYQDAKASVAEIERHADNRSFCQVGMLSRTPEPMGHRHYWPIYAAAEAADLPIGVHAFGHSGWPITGGGWASYYIEDMMSHAQSCQAGIASMVLEGVFEKFPRLKLVLVEGGLAWLPSLAWRLDAIWEKARSELPHVPRPPSEYIRENIWLTSQPIEEPTNRQQIVDVMDWIGWDRVLYASDYPHWDFDDPAQVLPVKLTKEQRQNFFIDNARRVYGFTDE